MSRQRDDKRIRRGALLVSSLHLTPDAGLDAYRRRRIVNPRADAATLKRAREVLDGVAFALISRDKSNWDRLDEAWEAIRRNKPPEDLQEVEPQQGVVAASDRLPSQAYVPPLPASSPEPPLPPAAPQPSAPLAPTPPPAAVASVAPAVPSPPPAAVASVAPAVPSPPPPAVASVAPAVPSPPPPAEASVIEDPPTQSIQPADAQALPFDLDAPASVPRPSADELPEHEQMGDTMGLTDSTLEALALPFHKVPQLTVEQYASFCAEEAAADDKQAVLARYDLADEAVGKALHESWRVMFAEDGALKTRFDQLLEHYGQWLAHERP